MKDWRLYNEFANGKPTGGGRIEQVHMLSLIAWIILLIACINFMNLATARSEKRAKEVGVRKVLGSGKKRLIAQFMGEAFMMSAIATIIAILIMSHFIARIQYSDAKRSCIGSCTSFSYYFPFRHLICLRLDCRQLSLVVFIIIQSCFCFKGS